MNTQNRIKWKIDDVEYEFLTAEEALKTNEVDISVVEELIELSECAYMEYNFDKMRGVDRGEKPVITRKRDFEKVIKDVDGNIVSTGKPRENMGCVCVRKDGIIIGTLVFSVRGENGNVGNITAGIIERGQRKNDKGPTNLNISKNLMRLVLPILLAKYNCDKVITMPISDRGRGYDRSNGFFDTKSKVHAYSTEKNKVTTYELDQRIVLKAREFLDKNRDEKDLEKLVTLLKDYLDPMIDEVSLELKKEYEREILEKESRTWKGWRSIFN